jgi:hypothetical protein
MSSPTMKRMFGRGDAAKLKEQISQLKRIANSQQPMADTRRVRLRFGV